MVDGVHRHAAGLRPYTLPAVAAGLADRDQLGFGVADLADRGPAVDGHATHLRGGQAQRGEVAFLGHKLDAHTRAAGDLAARPGLELDVVDHRADGDVAHRHGVAGPDVRALAAAEHIADLHPRRRQDVALLAVVVVEQADAGIAVGVVFDRGDGRGHAVLIALEIDDAVALLVPATAVTGGLAAIAVAAARAGLGREQRFLGPVLGDLAEVGDGLKAPAGGGGLAFAKGHRRLPHQLSNSGMRWPSARVTTARLVSDRRPKVAGRRMRLRLPLRLRVFTLTTCTLKIDSTAWRIWILLASG